MLNSILLEPFNDKARQLMITRHFLKPLADIKGYNDNIGSSDPKDLRDLPSYRLYSAHDTNIANILKLIKPDLMPKLKIGGDKVYDYIPYAANIYFEVYSDQFEEHGKKLRIKTMYNGDAIIFDECLDGEYCYYDEFMAHMDSVLYQGDLQAACD
jgi:hypothetical protein